MAIDSVKNNLILTTKMYPPPVTEGLVLRTHLLDRLEQNLHRPLTLISAPAGFGKSVLASMWLERCNCPSGWVSLDDKDNDLLFFAAYLLAAVKMALPTVSLQSEALLETSSPVPASMLARSFLNDLDQIETRFILVLDDLHTIHDNAIFDFLTRLLEHPLRAMHLVLISRQDPPLPVASLRAYRRVNEIRMQDLRFKTSETSKLLELVLQKEINEEMAGEWNRQAEGWATALHLIALSLRAKPEKRNMGIGVPFEEKSHYLHDYLLVEVLNNIPPDKESWLLRTALLDRFCAPLCEAVCLEDGEGLTGQTFLSWLQRSNLFLISLDNRNEWFRFHHLFQNQLRNRLRRQLNEKEIANHHQRASRWFVENGWIEEAMHHALLAGDSQTAVQLFGENRHQVMNEDRWLYLEHLLNLFPAEVVEHNPMLLITKAHVATLRSNYSELLSCLERARKLAADLPQDLPSAIEVQGEILTVQCIAAFLSGQIDKMIAYGQLAEERLPEASYYVRGVAAGSLIVGSQMSGDINRSAKVAGDLLADPAWPRLSRASIHLYLGYALWMNADLVSTKRTAYETLRLMKNQNVSTMAKSARYFLGAIFYLQNDLNRAEASLSTLLDNPASSPPTYLAHAACILSRIYCIQNRREEAQQILDSVSMLFEESANWSLVEIIRAFQVELALDQKNVIQAQQLGTSIDFDARPALWFYYIPQLTPTKLLYAQGTPAHFDKALFDLAQVEAYFHPLNRKTIYIDVLALQALVYEAQGKREEAVDRLQRSLELAASGGFIRNFVDLGQPMADLLSQLHRHGDTELSSYISRILAAFPVATVPSLPELDIRLSRREMEVLKFLATDLSPEEFALRMTISPATVRTHVRNIYAKLEVNRRIEAVHRAKELGLI